MSLLNELQRIMDLPNPEEEAKKKLIGTIMIVNGKPGKIISFDVTSNLIEVQGEFRTEIIKVKTLEVYLPESGVYSHPNGTYIIIQKIPKRQWLKSFNSSYYDVEVIGNADWNISLFDGIFDKKKQDIFVDIEKRVFFWSTQIGYIKDSSTIVCINKTFRQELIDWDKYDNH